MGQLRGQMWDASRAREADMAESRERLKETSRARLLKTIETKIRTAFVGALAACEQEMGVLWAGKTRPEEMTPAELVAWEAYQRARNQVLTNGNNQLRAVRAEIPLYEVCWSGYRNDMPEAGPRG